MESYDAGPTEVPIIEDTIGANFERTAAEHPDMEALVDVAQGLRWTYRELNDEIDVVARGLLGRGLAKGDRVGIWSPNRAEWTIVQYATAKIGAILVNIDRKSVESGKSVSVSVDLGCRRHIKKKKQKN